MKSIFQNLLKIFIVFGGFVNDNDDPVETEIFDPSVGSWRAGAALPAWNPARAVNIENRVLIFGKRLYN